MCDNWVGVKSVHHEQLIQHFQPFYIMELSEKHNRVWKGVWIGIVWTMEP